MFECKRTGCHLTALWQCGLHATLRWDGSVQHVLMTNMVVCGYHKDEVDIEDFAGVLDVVSRRMPVDIRDAYYLELHFDDISDGVWVNTQTMKKEKY